MLMSQQAADLGQAGALAQHLAGQSMTKLMCPAMAYLQSGSGNRSADDRAYAGW
jgi:hypothetical protein